VKHALAVMASFAVAACSVAGVRPEAAHGTPVLASAKQDPKPAPPLEKPQEAPAQTAPGAAPIATDAGPVPTSVQEDASNVVMKRPTYQSAFAQSAFIDHIQPYEPIYFATAPFDGWNSRMQFSMKYKILNEDGPIARSTSLAQHFYIGFTMESFWDIGQTSSPFVDTSYRPSFFYLNDALGRLGKNGRIGLQTGYEHESNGKGGEDSRSLNTLFVQPLLTFALDATWTLHLAPRFWVYVGDLSDNPDIADYRGHAEMLARIIDEEGFALATTFAFGDGGHSSLLADLTYPMNKLFWGNLDMYAQLQFFTGWGETLLRYDEHSPTEFRIGVMLVR
jgi:phospholipase A1/A2